MVCCSAACVLVLSTIASLDAAEPSAVGSTQLSTAEVLRRISTVGAYELPSLPLKTNQNYAYSSADVQPFGGVQPFKEHFLVQMEYTGPGRATPEPERVETVKIGFLGPILPTVSVATGGKSHEENLGIAMLRGARLAVEHANAKGVTTSARSRSSWWFGTTTASGAPPATRSFAWPTSTTSGPSWARSTARNTHIAIRVALKAELAMLTFGDLDPTYIETNIPWVFRNIGDDRQQNYLLADYLFRKMKYDRVAIIRSSNRYGRFGVREIRDGARRLGHPIVVEMAYKVGETNFNLQLDRIEEYKPQAIVHWGDGEDGARVLNALRARGMTQPFVSSDRCVSDEFVARREERRGRHLRLSVESRTERSEAGCLPQILPRQLWRRGRHLCRARVRRYEHVDVGRAGSRAQPG